MKNLLLELEKNNVDHFIARAFETSSVDEDNFRYEYTVYHERNDKLGKWSRSCQLYQNLRYKKMSEHEIRYFREHSESKYKIDHEDMWGKVWVNKSVGFNKKKFPSYGKGE